MAIGSCDSSKDRLVFADPDGLPLALVAQTATPTRGHWQPEGLPESMAIQGFAGMALASHRPASTARVLTELLGYRALSDHADIQAFASGGDGTGDVIELVDAPEWGQPGYGSVHHVAFRVADRSGLLTMLERVQAMGLPSSGEVDRFYFRSVYFREPGGMLFEIATDDPGFTIDESSAHLGESLLLTQAHEPMRASIEAALPALTLPDSAVNAVVTHL